MLTSAGTPILVLLMLWGPLPKTWHSYSTGCTSIRTKIIFRTGSGQLGYKWTWLSWLYALALCPAASRFHLPETYIFGTDYISEPKCWVFPGKELTKICNTGMRTHCRRMTNQDEAESIFAVHLFFITLAESFALFTKMLRCLFLVYDALVRAKSDTNWFWVRPSWIAVCFLSVARDDNVALNRIRNKKNSSMKTLQRRS